MPDVLFKTWLTSIIRPETLTVEMVKVEAHAEGAFLSELQKAVTCLSLRGVAEVAQTCRNSDLDSIDAWIRRSIGLPR